MNGLVIDCGCCVLRGRGCRDCVVSALLGEPGAGLPVLDAEEQRALHVMAQAGILPPLRLVHSVPPSELAPGPPTGRRRVAGG